jgi:hypothetical protein
VACFSSTPGKKSGTNVRWAAKRPQEDPEVRKVWYLLPICALVILTMGVLPTGLGGKLKLLVDNPLLLSITDDSTGVQEHVGRVIHKFGRNDEPTAADDVWDCSETAIGGPAVYPHQAAAFTLYASSDAAGDNGLTLNVEGLDANWDRQVVEATLDAADATDFVVVGTASNWLRVYRAYNTSASAFTGNIYLNNDPTDVGGDGIPDVLTGLQGCIQIGKEQTTMSLYTAADDEYTWVTQYCSTALSATLGATTKIEVKQRNNLPSAQAFRVISLFDLGTYSTTDRCQIFNPPLYVPKRADIKFTIKAVTNIDDVTATFDLVTIKE